MDAEQKSDVEYKFPTLYHVNGFSVSVTNGGCDIFILGISRRSNACRTNSLRIGIPRTCNIRDSGQKTSFTFAVLVMEAGQYQHERDNADEVRSLSDTAQVIRERTSEEACTI